MNGLSSDFYVILRKVLLDCHEFDSQASLRSVFVTRELALFRDRLPEAGNPSERVDAVVAFLLRKSLDDGRSLLPLFLATLRDRYAVGEEQRNRLNELVQFLHPSGEPPSPDQVVSLQLTSQDQISAFSSDPSSLLPGQRHQIETRQAELEKRFVVLTKQIGEIDTDIGLETLEFRKRPLVERRDDLEAERTVVSNQLAEIELKLAGIKQAPDP